MAIELTQNLAAYAEGTRFDDLPAAVVHEAARAFLNWIGVALGGCEQEAVQVAGAMIHGGTTKAASILGSGRRVSVADAAFVNCIASSVLAYDDAHLATVAHPSGPAAAALFALAQSRPVDGKTFLTALALGIELQCRVASMLVTPPSTFHPALYINGFSGPIGVAAAVGRVLGLGRQEMAWALGIAASQASGFRGTHGTMTAHFRPGHAARSGVIAAELAMLGFTCTDDALEAPGGFLEVYAPGVNASVALDQLGLRHEMLDNRYKPYPCGIVIHPVIDACLELAGNLPGIDDVKDIHLTVNPAVLRLTGKRSPTTALESHVSVFHWSAVCFLRGRAGLAESEPACLFDPNVVELRGRIAATADETIGTGAAKVTITLRDGTVRESHILHARGSLERPMSDNELETKFRELSSVRLPAAAVSDLESLCWRLADITDVGSAVASVLKI